MMNYEPPPDAFGLLLVGVGDLAGGPPRRSDWGSFTCKDLKISFGEATLFFFFLTVYIYGYRPKGP